MHDVSLLLLRSHVLKVCALVADPLSSPRMPSSTGPPACMRIGTCACACTCAFACICTCTSTFTHAHAHAHLQAHAHARPPESAYTHTPAFAPAIARHRHKHNCACACACACTGTFTCTSTCICACICTCACACLSLSFCARHALYAVSDIASHVLHVVRHGSCALTMVLLSALLWAFASTSCICLNLACCFL